jgi:hypothetical protein
MWIAIIIIVILLLIFNPFKFHKDREKLRKQIKSTGGMRVKYNGFISYLKEQTEANIVREDEDYIKIVMPENGTVEILQLFGQVKITWASGNILPKKDELKKSWQFPDNTDQKVMVLRMFEGIIKMTTEKSDAVEAREIQNGISLGNLTDEQKISVISFLMNIADCDGDQGNERMEMQFIFSYMDRFNLSVDELNQSMDQYINNLKQLTKSQKESLVCIAYLTIISDGNANETELITLGRIFAEIGISEERIVEIIEECTKRITKK